MHILHVSRHAGVAGAVLLPVAGLGVGVTQIVRGAVNTPEAVRELNKGRFWDQVSSKNIFTLLIECMLHKQVSAFSASIGLPFWSV